MINRQMRHSKLPLTVGLVIGFAVGVFVWQRFVTARLATENLQLREVAKQSAALAEENARLANERIDPDELKRLRDGQAELLRLRAQVAGLLREVDAARKMATNKLANALPEAAPIAATNEWRAYTNAANVTATLGWEEVLVTGGWLAPGGKRVVFVVLPRRGSQPNPVQLEFRWYEVPEDVFVRLEKHSLRAEPQDSITKNIWIPESTQAILDIFERTDGVAPRSKGPLAIMSGNSGQISDEISQTIGAIGVGEKYLINTTFDWVPKISPDGQLIELTLNVQQDVKRVPSP